MDPLLFEKTAKFVKDISDYDSLRISPSISDNDKLKLYALYKQATVGSCTGPRPSFFDLQGKYKYDTWKELGDMSKTLAMHNYVERVVGSAMSIQSSLCEFSRSHSGKNADKDYNSAQQLRNRLEELKYDCAILWPQRFAHLRSPGAHEVTDINYEKEEVASFEQKDDNSFGTPLVLSDEIRIPLSGKITSFLSGSTGKRSTVDDPSIDFDRLTGEDDPLHVKEPPVAEISSDSLNRGVGISGELYEMVMSSFRRLDALEDLARKMQQRLDQIAQERNRFFTALVRVTKTLTCMTGSAVLLYILFRLIRLRRNLR